MLPVTFVGFTWKVVIKAFSPVFNLLDERFHGIFEICSIDIMLKP
jgi:hypothetical protein